MIEIATALGIDNVRVCDANEDENAKNENEMETRYLHRWFVTHWDRLFGSLQSGHHCIDALHPHATPRETDI